jgi:hypothetical protein
MNLVGKTFRAISNSKNGHLDTDTEMRFTSDDSVVEGVYGGGTIEVGHVLAKRSGEFTMDMLYHGATKSGAHKRRQGARHILTRQGRSYPNGSRLAVAYGDQSKGQSEWMLIDDAT